METWRSADTALGTISERRRRFGVDPVSASAEFRSGWEMRGGHDDRSSAASSPNRDRHAGGVVPTCGR
jgi:hypothetical protein